MSMYGELLRTALGQASPVQGTEPSWALLEVYRRKAALQSARSARHVDADAGLMAEQLFYDVALIALCHQVGISVDVAAFDRPWIARRHLETQLRSRGLLAS